MKAAAAMEGQVPLGMNKPAADFIGYDNDNQNPWNPYGSCSCSPVVAPTFFLDGGKQYWLERILWLGGAGSLKSNIDLRRSNRFLRSWSAAMLQSILLTSGSASGLYI